MRAPLAFLIVLAGCVSDSGHGADSDSDSDSDTTTGTDSGDACAADCDTLNVSKLAAADQTPENLTMESTCESTDPADYTREIQNVVDGADGLPTSWTELRTYDRPDKGNYHEVRTEYVVSSRCSDGRLEELSARMHSLRPLFESTCQGVYCFEGL
jgi:hypothetical protein